MKHPNFKQAAEAMGATLSNRYAWGATLPDGRGIVLGLWADEINLMGAPKIPGCQIVNLIRESDFEYAASKARMSEGMRERLQHIAAIEAGVPAVAFISPCDRSDPERTRAEFVDGDRLWEVLRVIRNGDRHADAVVRLIGGAS
jgi:hypothetical protein